MAENIGRVISVSGPAVDVQFEEAKMPPIYQALRITSEGFTVPTPLNVVVEVQQHLGEGRVRCIAMVATEGMVRGMNAHDTGSGIMVPVGRETLGRPLLSLMTIAAVPLHGSTHGLTRKARLAGERMRPLERQTPSSGCGTVKPSLVMRSAS